MHREGVPGRRDSVEESRPWAQAINSGRRRAGRHTLGERVVTAQGDVSLSGSLPPAGREARGGPATRLPSADRYRTAFGTRCSVTAPTAAKGCSGSGSPDPVGPPSFESPTALSTA